MSHTKAIVGLAVVILMASAFFVAAKDRIIVAADATTTDASATRAALTPKSETPLPDSSYEYLPIDGIPYFSIRAMAGVPDSKPTGSR